MAARLPATLFPPRITNAALLPGHWPHSCVLRVSGAQSERVLDGGNIIKPIVPIFILCDFVSSDRPGSVCVYCRTDRDRRQCRASHRALSLALRGRARVCVSLCVHKGLCFYEHDSTNATQSSRRRRQCVPFCWTCPTIGRQRGEEHNFEATFFSMRRRRRRRPNE